MSGLLDQLRWRGLVHQVSGDDLGGLVDRDPITVYVGMDPSASSLHVGNLVGLCTLRRFQDAGHKPIYLAGGSTGMIGDPGGRSDERNLLSREQVEANVAGIRAQMARFLDVEAGAVLVDNYDWTAPVRYLDFLRDVGKHVSVNQMLAKESVRARIENPETGISYTEFSYMLLQAFDYLVLFDRYGCRLQMGGSDQWGNITAGIELIRRMRSEHVHALTWPLLTRADGAKMGKSADGAVWLDATMTSPYALYQYLFRTDDGDVSNRLRVFTFLAPERIEDLDAGVRTAPEKREAQRALAWEVTSLVHGAAAAERAVHAAAVLFSEEIASLDEATLLDVMADAPSAAAPRAVLDGGWALTDALVACGLVSSKSEGRRAIAQGGASVNNRRVDDPDNRLSRADLLHDAYVVLRRGKRDVALLRIEA